jgi:hypothetical protein
MRNPSAEFDAEVAGTTSGDRLEVNAWRGGVLVAADLPVSSWGLTWDADREVQGQASFTFADPDGTLAPWGLGDALGAGGSRLQVTWVSGLSGIRVPLGWWRIRAADPEETWRVVRSGYRAPSGIWPNEEVYPSEETWPELVQGRQDGSVVRVSGGGVVSVNADEETATIALDRLDGEVVRAASVVDEVRRLLVDICAVVTAEGVVDKAAPGSLVYGESRLDAVRDLLATIDATYRMAPDGSLEVVPRAGVGPVWTLAGGDDGVLVKVTRRLSDEGVYNAVTSMAETADGAPLVGRAHLSGGPLEWGGPFGRVPMFHRSPATTQEGVEADARTLLENRTRNGEVDLAVTCLTHPGVQPNDRVTVVAATTVGDAPLEGRVVGASMTSAQGVPAKRMSLTVRVSAESLELVAGRVRRAR